MKRNKKGFTLIELLAVIVILAVVSLIATPIVLNLVEKARKGAFARSAEGVLKSGKLYYASSLLEPSGASDITFNCDGEKCVSQDGTDKEVNLDVDGQMGKGSVKIYQTGETEFTLTNGTYCAIKYRDAEQVTIEDGDCSDAESDYLESG